ncbi:uncharacterized protein DNG_05721 [Cephalotrichum gorgonifer]|uniref:ADF-H domain-containing protein n=1 Tax=Cephalotrichum gorgonifer TaxID=2041049 RepID=A0AAE8N1B7_9PEZI|nr:uncharacterized protein DNG_05721 [Cephalotrichum gorgonifer]
MSLNGLDDIKVKEAHTAAVAEPGGWFILKYAARDEVELLGRGNGGVSEIRNAIAEYEETSPLYGFLRYRRRSVLIKYLPEDCSRLIQARVTVHFLAVCERFSPHDSTFSISTAAELKDTKLSAACSLHAASGSTSSSTSSLRRRRLGEIVEEDEEERVSKRQSVGEADAEIEPPAAHIVAGLETEPPPPREPPVTLNADIATSPDGANFTTATQPPDFVGTSPPSPRKSFDTSARRMSSQSTRTEFYNAYGRQKVKLGPRPSIDTTGRPRTAAGPARAVSTVPAGFKPFSKGSKKGKSKDTDSASVAERENEVPETSLPAVHNIPIPPVPDFPEIEEPRRPHTSSGASFVMPSSSFKATPAKEKITPEKARLMKAMQLREKKKMMSMLPPVSPGPSSLLPQDIPEEVEAVVLKPVDAASVEEESGASGLPAGDVDKDDGMALSQADSAIVMEASTSTINDQASDATQSDSHPTSPFITQSEADQSTKASSVSGSTDETVQARDSLLDKDSEEEHVNNTVDDDLEETIPSTPPQDGAPSGQPTDTQVDADETPVATPVTVEEPASETTDDAVKQAEQEQEQEQGQEPEEDTAQPRVNTTLPVSKFSAATPDTTQDEVKETVSAQSDAASEQEVTEETKGPQLRIPKSKFSTPDLSASPETHAPPVPVISTTSDVHNQTETSGGEPELVTDENMPEVKDADSAAIPGGASRRTVNLDPINTGLTHPSRSARSSQHLSDDEDLLDELQSAVVQEAMPVTVAKSPLSPIFPPAVPAKDSPPKKPAARTVSQPAALRPALLSPTDIPLPTGRSISSGTAFLNKISQNQQASAPPPKKATVGTSISQRIKALQKLSSGTPEAEGPAKSPSGSLFSARKVSGSRQPSRSPSVIERATPFIKNSPPPESPNGSPEAASFRHRSRDRSASLKNRLSMFETGASPPRGRTESIQVRAKIVRTPSQPIGNAAEPKDPSDFKALDLKQSPLVVDHLRAQPANEIPDSNPAPVRAPKETIQERRMSRETRRSESRDRDAEMDRKSRRSSLSIVKGFIKDRRMSLTSASVDNLMTPVTPMTPSRSPSRPPSTHHNSISRRLSISSRRSSISRDNTMTPTGPLSPSAYTETSGSGDDSKSTNGEKRPKSRTGRFMRRLSSSLGGRSKSTPTGISPTLHEEVSSEAVGMGETRGPAMAAYMGDVNVQFPDNLLWKRRCLCLDSQGFLVLSPIAASATPQPSGGAGLKRYHLSEFRTPYTPDMEVQELPNSVVLDFIEGSGLQIACEDRVGQLSVLHTLQDAHKNHSSFGQ